MVSLCSGSTTLVQFSNVFCKNFCLTNSINCDMSVHTPPAGGQQLCAKNVARYSTLNSEGLGKGQGLGWES